MLHGGHACPLVTQCQITSARMHLLDCLHDMSAYLLVTPIEGTLAQAFMPSNAVHRYPVVNSQFQWACLCHITSRARLPMYSCQLGGARLPMYSCQLGGARLPMHSCQLGGARLPLG